MTHTIGREPVLDREGRIARPAFDYDQLVVRLPGTKLGGPEEHIVGRVTGLLVLDENGYHDLRHVANPDYWDEWAYTVEYAEGLGDEICIAFELEPLGASGM